MKAAEGRPMGPLAALAVGLALVLGGCAAPRACYCRDRSGGVETTSAYTVACPDVLTVTVTTQPDLTGRIAIGPDGAIPLGPDGGLRIEGLTPDEVAGRLTTILGVPRDAIQVQVAEYASRQVFLCGPVEGHELAVPYQGPEPVVDFLHRVGGLSRDAEPRDVHIVRANVAAGRRPEVFQVDLKAIQVQKDGKTNIALQPYDQVYVGESSRSCLARCLPPWMHLRKDNPVDARP